MQIIGTHLKISASQYVWRVKHIITDSNSWREAFRLR